MSVDLHLSLPPNVRVDDVARVLGRLLGCSGERSPLADTSSYFAKIEHTNVKACADIPECAYIFVGERRFLYHFENPGGRRLIMMRSTAPNIALACAAADFFGGRVTFRDDADSPIDHAVADKGENENHPDDGDPWHLLQDRILAIQPLTDHDVDRYRDEAAYAEPRLRLVRGEP